MGRLGCRETVSGCREEELRCQDVENTREKRLKEWNWETTPTEKLSSAQDLLLNADTKRKGVNASRRNESPRDIGGLFRRIGLCLSSATDSSNRISHDSIAARKLKAAMLNVYI
jgi:hypothetical protein